MKKSLFLALTLALSLGMILPAKAQMNYRKGWIITLEGDTIHGLVRDQGTLRCNQFCIFKSERDADPVLYTPTQITGYEATGYKRFHSMEWERDADFEKVFAEVLLEGEMDLYHNWRTKDLAYVVRDREDHLTALQVEEVNFRKKADIAGDYYAYGEKYEGFITFYKDSLKSIFADQPEIAEKVDGLTYHTRKIKKITKEYVMAGCENDPCISYEKDMRLTRDRFGILGGVQASRLYYASSPEESGWVLSYPVGLFYQIPLGYFNERISFQMEVLYRHLLYDPIENLQGAHVYRYIESHAVGIPLLLQYRLSVKPFSPVIGIGKELGFNVASESEYHYWDYETEELVVDEYSVHTISKGGWFLDLGIDFELGKNLSLFTKLRIQRYRNKIISDGVENNVIFRVADGEETWTDTGQLFLGIRF